MDDGIDGWKASRKRTMTSFNICNNIYIHINSLNFSFEDNKVLCKVGGVGCFIKFPRMGPFYSTKQQVEGFVILGRGTIPNGLVTKYVSSCKLL
jgi:hypothetical protein